jgi:hypothetical protein
LALNAWMRAFSRSIRMRDVVLQATRPSVAGVTPGVTLSGWFVVMGVSALPRYCLQLLCCCDVPPVPYQA